MYCYAGSVLEKNYWKAFLILLAGTTLFRLFYIQWIELAPDEAYYWTWAKQLQWGYYDHPPMVGFLIWLFTMIGGQGEFGVRWGWVLIGSLTAFFIYRLGTEMFKSPRAGFYSALLLNISLLGSTGAIIATPDGPQGLFWALGIYFIFKAMATQKGDWWYGVGLALGLGLISKYTMILLVPCVFLFLLSTAEERKWLRRREPYLALLLALLLFFPVIFWNAQHDWISFRMQLYHGLEIKEIAGLTTFGYFWAGQAGVVTPLLFLALIWVMIRCGIKGFLRQNSSFLLLFWTSVPVLSFFAYTSLRAKVEANWPALAYFTAVIALVGFVNEEGPGWGKIKKGFAWLTVLSAILITLTIHIQPIHALIPIPAQKDLTSQLWGWRVLGEKLKEVARSIEAGKDVFLLTPNHQLVGEGMFYTQGKIPIYQWDAPWRLNHLSAIKAPPLGSLAIFFTENQEELPEGLASLFESCVKMDTLFIRRNSSLVRTHSFWKCWRFRGLQGNPPLPL